MERYQRMPCGSLVKAEDVGPHRDECDACREGYSVFDLTESEERALDDPRRGQAAALNSERYKP